MNVAAVILAAGFSRRLGRPKQEIVLAGQTLLERAIHTAIAAGLHPVIAVVREERWCSVAEALGATSIVNDQAEEGMASSVRLGIGALCGMDLNGAVILTCDQPLLRAEHLRALADDPMQVKASAYDGRAGVPAFFPELTFAKLLTLQGDQGARGLLQGVPTIADEELALDIDTDEDVRRAQLLFQQREGR